MSVPALTVALCTYNRSSRLPGLIGALRQQRCTLPWRILVVDNNSSDETPAVLQRLAAEPGVRLDVVREAEQGIVPARNRSVTESLGSIYLLVMDDDEVPMPGWVHAALTALSETRAQCVGGRVRVRFDPAPRPSWLGNELLGFLAEVDYGEEPFWIRDESTPVWTANVGFRTELFRDGLRFDSRYSRVGKAIGGGEDVIMFRSLLAKGAHVRYEPRMVVEHFVEEWRLRRRYFLRLHYSSGYNSGLHELPDYGRKLCGVPPFLIMQALKHGGRTLAALLAGNPRILRQCMNVTYTAGMIAGCFERWRES